MTDARSESQSTAESAAESKAPGAGRLLVMLGLLVVTASAVAATGISSRLSASDALSEWTQEHALPTVAIIRPESGAALNARQLPARIEAAQSTDIHARVSGYLAAWHVDIGQRVEAGALLAEVDTPELDQRLSEARADLRLAAANAELSKSEQTRWQTLFDQGSVSRQALDQVLIQARVADAETDAAQARLNALETEKAFARIAAPYAGIITARNAETGMLIESGSNGGDALFAIADTSHTYVYADVPQSMRASLSLGQSVHVGIPGVSPAWQPGAAANARLLSSSGRIERTNGTLLYKFAFDAPDSSNAPEPGSYALVTLDPIYTDQPRVNGLVIPSSALIINGAGVHVATLAATASGSDSPPVQVRLKPVSIARDLGRTVVIDRGLEADDEVVVNPPDGVMDDALVRVVASDA